MGENVQQKADVVNKGRWVAGGRQGPCACTPAAGCYPARQSGHRMAPRVQEKASGIAAKECPHGSDTCPSAA
jgi:hypothetical protein